jgi:hypothetical protein
MSTTTVSHAATIDGTRIEARLGPNAFTDNAISHTFSGGLEL